MKTKYIVTYLTGGLGNQMFQYSLARKLMEEIPDSRIVLDQESYKTYHLRNSEIQNFRLCNNVIFSKDGLKGFPRARFKFFVFCHRVIFKLLKKPENGMKHFPDSIFQFFAKRGYLLDLDSDFHQIPYEKIKKHRFIFIYGYFQSPLYFSDIRSLLIEDFSLKSPMTTQGILMKQKLASFDSVCFSFRCGDYKKLGYFLSDIDQHYFSFLHDELCGGEEFDSYALFTDDPTNAFSFFSFSKNYLPGYRLPIAEQLLVMSECTIFYLSNSTYSWWGAFLSTKTGKKIYGPEFWFPKTRLRDLGLYYSDITIK